MTDTDFITACATACPHCAGGSEPRYRPETKEYVHDFAARDTPIDTPSLAAQGGPIRLMPGTFAHTFCLATNLRRTRDLKDNAAS